jgi:hypothetical protein
VFAMIAPCFHAVPLEPYHPVLKYNAKYVTTYK